MDRFEDLKGKTLQDIHATDDQIVFTLTDNTQYKLYHSQDCCEDVHIADINGELMDLIGSPILRAEESTSDCIETDESIEQWTFYKLATVNGYVDIRWIGESNGYYSVSVEFEEIKN